jgi:catechol 2,3-dioxygenase-like lactoylglutathione lyase family enzyme
MKKLKSVGLVTQDVRGLCDFYASVLDAHPEGDEAFAMFSGPELNLTISACQLVEKMAPGLTVHSQPGTCFLEFEVDDVDQEYERLQALQIDVLKPPTTQPWGLRSVWFCDPDGNKINFYAHVTAQNR